MKSHFCTKALRYERSFLHESKKLKQVFINKNELKKKFFFNPTNGKNWDDKDSIKRYN